MKKRILTGWTFRRLVYLLLGVFVICESGAMHQWIGILPGLYLASMGIFAFGCASGNCFGNTCDARVSNKKERIKEVNENDSNTNTFL